MLLKKRQNKLKECQKLVISPHEHRSLKELLFEKTSFFVKLYICEEVLADDNLIRIVISKMEKLLLAVFENKATSTI